MIATLKKYLSLLKDYLPLFIFIPTTLGGIWQIYALAKISPPYIRFFSITQLVADGLLIFYFSIIVFLYLCLIMIISHYGTYKTFRNDFRHKSDRGDHLLSTEIHWSQSIWIKRILTPLFIFYGVCVIYLGYTNFSEKQDLTPSRVSNFWYFSLSGLLAIMTVAQFWFRKLGYFQTRLNLLRTAGIICGIIMIVYCTIITFAEFHKAFSQPKDLMNLSTLHNNITKEEHLVTYKIIYFNDQYIFVEKHYKNCTDSIKVEVLKFDSLFENHISN